MKKVVLLVYLSLSFYKGNCQDVISPYFDYSGFPMPSYSVPGSGYEFLTDLGLPQTNYNGEYMIQFNLLWWFNNYLSGQNFEVTYHKSYKIEVVGFPFVANCAWTPVGCADGSTTTRLLEMPNFNLINNQWGTNLWRLRENIQITTGTHLGEAADLITHHYTNQTALPTTGNPYYPHTTHKITLYIHCGDDQTDIIADSLIFYYDHTRGRMRDYPFITQNSSSAGGSTDWDVVIRPRLVYKDFGFGHTYSQSSNDDIYLPGKSINYFPFKFGNNCETVLDSYTFFEPIQGDFLYISPPPYALTSSLIYTQYNYSTLAGYLLSSGSNLAIRPGIKHTYTIQNNFDLAEVNPIQKIIYNPSEVNITATNLVFPSYYTFKTIRGTHPTEFEIQLDNTNSDNGGPYVNPLDIPVTTDLYSENPSDPQNEHVYASRYYLKPGSMLTINPCVKIFDATFDIDPGATLIIDNYEQMIGKEDKSYYNGRYKLRGFGGAILRNYSTVQYVQNGDISQTVALNYIATSYIIAGENVDLDADQPDGIYDIKAGADVTFTAGDYIHLTNGFYVSGGDFHAVINENLPVPDYCYPNNGQNGGNRVMQQPSTIQSQVFNSISVLPNPNHGTFTISMKGSNFINAVSLFDVTGRSIYNKNSLNEKSHEIQLTSELSGLLIGKVENEKGETSIIKVMVE